MLIEWEDQISNSEREGLENVYDASEGSEVIILDNINDDTIVDACKVPPTLEEV